MKRTHLDLFSGIGGFTLAAHWAGFETVGFCEINPDCRRFLERAWPGIPIYDDIKTLDGRTFAGVSLLTAGVPCQPASRAGKQRGKEDDRWLWGEALRVLNEAKPAWAVFENPPGIGDVGLAGILAEMESHGYEVRVFGIPACAVGAPHRRERYWIVCHRLGLANGDGPQGQERGALPRRDGRLLQPTGRPGVGVADAGRIGSGQDEPRRGPGERTANGRLGAELAHAQSGGQRIDGSAPGNTGHPDERGESSLGDTTERERESRGSRTDQRGRIHTSEGHVSWNNFVWLPCADGKVRRAPDDSFGLVDGLHRSLLAALGNSIVPQVAFEVLKAIIEAEE